MRGSAQTVLFRAGSFFGDEKQAERVIRERSGRLAVFEKTKANIREGQLAVIPSAIRSSIRHEHYVFIVSKRSSFSKLLNGSSGLMNNTSMSGSEKMPGGNDQRIAAALCHCPLFEIRAANCKPLRFERPVDDLRFFSTDDRGYVHGCSNFRHIKGLLSKV